VPNGDWRDPGPTDTSALVSRSIAPVSVDEHALHCGEELLAYRGRSIPLLAMDLRLRPAALQVVGEVITRLPHLWHH
jgi:hypothetical protein